MGRRGTDHFSPVLVLPKKSRHNRRNNLILSTSIASTPNQKFTLTQLKENLQITVCMMTLKSFLITCT